MPHKRKFLLYFSLIFVFGLFVSCGKKTNPDLDYYFGLQRLSEGKYDEARSKLNHCKKKGSYTFARESAITLTTFGSLQDKTKACQELLRVYNDSDTRLIAARHFILAGETGLAIEATYGLNFEEDDNELIKIRLECLKERDNSHFDEEVFKWFMVRPISDFHYKFYKDNYKIEKESYEMTPEEFAISYRIDLYKRNYLGASEKSQTLLNLFEEKKLNPYSQLISDLGKALLYGNSNYLGNAVLFTEKAEEFKNTDAEFYFWFYSGRLYDKANTYFSQAKNSFTNAVNSTLNSDQKDNAIWYLLTISLNYSVNTIIDSITAYAREWTDTEYFEDFFEKCYNN